MQPNGTLTRSFCIAALTAAILLASPGFGQCQFVAFWDHVPGTNQTQTHPNTTLGNNYFGLNHAYPIILKNITNGLNTGVTMTLSNGPLADSAFVGGDRLAQNPFSGTPLYNTFYYVTNDPGTGQPTNYSYVYFGQSTNDSSIKITNASVEYIFSGLNPQARYSFRGGAVRGGDATFENRWTQVEIVGADFFTPRMTSNILTHLHTSDLASNQVAVNFACNHTPATGDMVGWDDIAPGPDGTVFIICTRYAGTVPGGSSGGGPVYALTGIRFEEKILPVLQVQVNTNRTLNISWTLAAGTLQQSTNLLQWTDSALTNGATLNPAGKWFFRVRQ